MMIRVLLALLLFCSTITVNAVEKLEVQGLFSNKAVLSIDGKRYVLAVGDASPEGVKVISADSRGAVLQVDGRQKQYNLGNTVSTVFAERKTLKETIYKNNNGMYLTYGAINGHSVRFLVDTGASAISMNTAQAKQFGIHYKKTGTPMGVSTASGYVNAYRIQLNSVTVGDISQRNVEAYVIAGKHPGPVLLGMTFLGKLNVEHSGNAMTLIQND